MTSQRIIENEMDRNKRTFDEHIKELARFSKTANWKEALHETLGCLNEHPWMIRLIAEWRGCDESDLQITRDGHIFIRNQTISDNAYASLSRYLCGIYTDEKVEVPSTQIEKGKYLRINPGCCFKCPLYDPENCLCDRGPDNIQDEDVIDPNCPLLKCSGITIYLRDDQKKV